MARNVLIDSDLVKLYCIHVIPLYGSVMIILLWWYYYYFFIEYIRIDNIYNSDDLPLTQRVINCNTGVNTKDKDAEDEEDDENYVEMPNEGENEGKILFVIDITSLC